MRTGIRSLLQKLPELDVVGEAADGPEALQLIRQHEPDLVLMERVMPKLNGLEVTARVKKELPKVRVIILSLDAAGEYVRQALRCGAAGYLLKNASVEELETAVRVVASGNTYLSPQLSKDLIDYMHPLNEGTLFERLTPRQQQILLLIAEGRSTKEIALALDISVKTVESHRKQLTDRLDIHDLAGLIRYAIKAKLIRLDD
jgi:DNA-binding NarL/FixJ family response regulator